MIVGVGVIVGVGDGGNVGVIVGVGVGVGVGSAVGVTVGVGVGHAPCTTPVTPMSDQLIKSTLPEVFVAVTITSPVLRSVNVAPLAEIFLSEFMYIATPDG